MKTLNITFSDEEFKELIDAKTSLGEVSWHDMIIILSKKIKVKKGGVKNG